MACTVASSAVSTPVAAACRSGSAPARRPAALSARATRAAGDRLSSRAAVFTGRAPRATAPLRADTTAAAGRAARVAIVASAEAPVALVTGSSRGIGLAIALELAKNGCKLVINSFSEGETLEAAAEACRAAGSPQVIAIAGDVSKKDQVDAMIKKTVEEMGSLDILVNNAGITRDTLVLRMKPDQWQQVIDVNLTGVFYCAQAAAKVMSKQRRGRIINIASVVGQMGNAGQANYSAAKGGVIAMTKTFAREFASRGVTINAVAPGFIKSDMTAAIDPKYEGAILAQIPLGRMGEASEVAGMTRFLAIDEAALYITGHTFNVDGGMAMV
eukprot:jgi/Tetstr1/455070/TSEL_041924.t1